MDHLSAILERLLFLHPREIDLSLERMNRLLAALGNPERALAPVVHVAGTNGKGSTIAFLRAMLEADGKRVHAYISPHLVRFNERIRLAAPGGGRLVEDDTLIEALLEAERANGAEPITFFEITTAAAFLLFARRPADIVLLETGLGGRLDATNVVERPLACALTPVSHDHAKFLGDAIEGIAFEKAGILKSGVPAVVARQSEEALGVIEARAEALGAPLSVLGRDWTVFEERGRLVFQDERGLLDLPLPRLPGRHQHENAGAAIAVLRAAPGLWPGDKALEAGLERAVWPARLQRLREGRLLAALPPGREVWLDGGHNPDGGRAIAAAMAEREEKAPRALALVFSMLNTKDAAGYLANFQGLAQHVVTVPITRSAAGVPAGDLAEAARSMGFTAHAEPDLAAGLARAASLAGRVLVCGSFYLAGDVLAENGTPPDG